MALYRLSGSVNLKIADSCLYFRTDLRYDTTQIISCIHIDLKTKHVHDIRLPYPPDTHPTPNTPSPVQPRFQKVGDDDIRGGGGVKVIIKQLYVI